MAPSFISSGHIRHAGRGSRVGGRKKTGEVQSAVSDIHVYTSRHGNPRTNQQPGTRVSQRPWKTHFPRVRRRQMTSVRAPSCSSVCQFSFRDLTLPAEVILILILIIIAVVVITGLVLPFFSAM